MIIFTREEKDQKWLRMRETRVKKLREGCARGKSGKQGPGITFWRQGCLDTGKDQNDD